MIASCSPGQMLKPVGGSFSHQTVSLLSCRDPGTNERSLILCRQTSILLWCGLRGFSEKAMAPHSSTLAWKIPWMEEPGRLQSMGSRRVRHDCATSLSRIGEGNGNPLQCSCLENPRDGGAWWASVYGVAQSQTRLRRLSSSSSSKGFLGSDPCPSLKVTHD